MNGDPAPIVVRKVMIAVPGVLVATVTVVVIAAVTMGTVDLRRDEARVCFRSPRYGGGRAGP